MKSAEESLREGLPTKFTTPGGKWVFEARGPYRMSCTSVGITHKETKQSIGVSVRLKDNIPMAIAVLGNGRVNRAVEECARSYAEVVLNSTTDSGGAEDEIIDEVLVRLRAIMLLREHEAEQKAAESAEAERLASESLLDDAYGLYLLSHKAGTWPMTKDEFLASTASDVWRTKLRVLRGEAVL